VWLSPAEVRDVVFSRSPGVSRDITRMRWTNSLVLFTLS